MSDNRDRLARHYKRGVCVFRATFSRYGKEKLGRASTLLVTNLYDGRGVYMCDHVWMRRVAPFVDLKVRPGDYVEFKALVVRYRAGYMGEKGEAFGLDDPRDVRIIRRKEERSG